MTTNQQTARWAVLPLLLIVGAACSATDHPCTEGGRQQPATELGKTGNQAKTDRSALANGSTEIEPFVSSLYSGMPGAEIIETVRRLSGGPGASDELGTVLCLVPRGHERRLYAFITQPTKEVPQIRDRQGNALPNDIFHDYLVAVVRVDASHDARKSDAYFPGVYIFPSSVEGKIFTGIAGIPASR